MIENIIIIVLFAAITGLLFVINHILGAKEHYRCRVFELTNGEEGSNLVKVVPTWHHLHHRRSQHPKTYSRKVLY